MDNRRTTRLNPPLHGRRVHLEPMRERHAEALFPVLADPALYRWIDHGPPASVQRLRDVYRRIECRQSPDGQETWLNWVLFASNQAGPLGFVQASLLSDGRAWVAYVLGQPGWGQGYATEAVATLLAHLFGALGAQQAMATVEQDNTRSIALLLRLDFQRASAAALQGHELTATEQLWLLDAPRAGG